MATARGPTGCGILRYVQGAPCDSRVDGFLCKFWHILFDQSTN